MSGRSPIAPRTSSAACGRYCSLIVLSSSRGPSPGANALVKASISPSGFFRWSVEKKSNMNANVNRPGSSRSSSTPLTSGTVIAWGTTTTGTGARRPSRSATNVELTQISSTYGKPADQLGGSRSVSQAHAPTVTRPPSCSRPPVWTNAAS